MGDVKLELFGNETKAYYRVGDVIYHEGERPESMFVVLDGQVEIGLHGTTVELLGPGEPFGEMALVDKSPRLVTATAMASPTVVAVVSEERFLFMVEQTPYFALKVMRVLAQRLRASNRTFG